MDTKEKEVQLQLERYLKNFEPQRSSLIPMLQAVQSMFGYLPSWGMEQVARHLSVPVGEVYGVATFYNQFRLTPPGKYQVKVCTGTACHVKRSYVILEEWERRLGIKEGETTADRLFSLEKVACVGCCALAPVVVVRQDSTETFYGHMMTSKVNGLIMEVERKERNGPTQ